MSWIHVDSSAQTRSWGGTDFESYRPNGGIGHREWFETDTGAGYCLVAEGAGQTGGQYYLLFKANGSDKAVDVTQLLWPVETLKYPQDADSTLYSEVRAPIVAFVNELLGARPFKD
ncbi:hypothetical protein [Brevibacterium picturae]|uniref:Uncharacterized protein n=1 Tax=Brevibacterium picturae TaxID=260553 RepID=A0ABN2B424_9MICO